MQIVEISYTLFGCRPGCVHRGADEVTDEVCNKPKTRDDKSTKYIARTTSPVCAMSCERGKIRQEIYQRADLVKQNALRDGRMLRTANKRWNKVADEWRNFVCPFFTPHP